VNATLTQVTADEYHADPCDRPSLSASIAQTLYTSSPAHAHAAHPKLNPQVERTDATHFDIGTSAHALLLEGRDTITVVDAKDWRTKAAQEERDRVRADGGIPLLPDQAERVRTMVATVREQLNEFDAEPSVLVGGAPEQMVVWEENGVLCRALLDWLHADGRTVDDLKTTSGSASPERWSRSMFDRGYDVQAAFYSRGVEALTGRRPVFRFVVVETAPPFAVSVFTPGPDVLAVADAKVKLALRLWSDCLETGRWPGYPRTVCTVELPPWEETRFMERDERAAA
jgi:hypothetical protein